eukprot:3445078-Prymnesium_polylepis.1
MTPMCVLAQRSRTAVSVGVSGKKRQSGDWLLAKSYGFIPRGVRTHTAFRFRSVQLLCTWCLRESMSC